MGENPPGEYVPEHRGEEPKSAGLMSNRTYDRLKFVAMILLPAIGTAYFSLADIWDLPKAMEVVGTITIVDTFLGALLGISNAKHNNDPKRFAGKIVYQDAGEGQEPNVHLILNDDTVRESEKEKEVIFKIFPR